MKFEIDQIQFREFTSKKMQKLYNMIIVVRSNFDKENKY